MLAVVSIEGQDILCVGLWVVLNCSVMVLPRMSVVKGEVDLLCWSSGGVVEGEVYFVLIKLWGWVKPFLPTV